MTETLSVKGTPEHTIHLSRRQLLGYTGVILGGSLVASQVDNIKKYIRSGNEVIIGRDDGGLHAEYGGDRFRIVDGSILLRGSPLNTNNPANGYSLESVLRKLNKAKNPSMNIDGDPFSRLKDVYELVNSEPTIRNLNLGEQKKVNTSISSGRHYNTPGHYLFPYYMKK